MVSADSTPEAERIFLWTTCQAASAFCRPDGILSTHVSDPWRSSMELFNAVYMKFRALIQFIERADAEFLEGEVDDH